MLRARVRPRNADDAPDLAILRAVLEETVNYGFAYDTGQP
jgi:hypothetical protein